MIKHINLLEKQNIVFIISNQKYFKSQQKYPLHNYLVKLQLIFKDNFQLKPIH